MMKLGVKHNEGIIKHRSQVSIGQHAPSTGCCFPESVWCKRSGGLLRGMLLWTLDLPGGVPLARIAAIIPFIPCCEQSAAASCNQQKPCSWKIAYYCYIDRQIPEFTSFGCFRLNQDSVYCGLNSSETVFFAVFIVESGN